MEGYYILVGILTIFFIGIISIIYDMVFNVEEETIIRNKPAQQENLARFISDDYTDADYDDN